MCRVKYVHVQVNLDKIDANTRTLILHLLASVYVLICRGRRIQALSWTTEGFSAAKLKKQEMERQSRDLKDLRVKEQLSLTSGQEEMKKPQFELIPNKFVLEPYQSCVVTLKGYSDM